MALPVCLQDIAGELQLVSDMSCAYLNRRTGETCVLTEDDLDRIQKGEDDLLEWEWETLPLIQNVLESEDWLEMPSQRDIDEYHIIEQFCRSAERAVHREQLLNAIRGRGAFRRFRNAIERLGILESWYAHRDRALEDIAAAWLEEEEVPFTRDNDG